MLTSEIGSSNRIPVMTDVARLAQVSHQTVSRVLNRPEGVRPATRDRVLAAIDTLGYRRNSAARALVTGRSLTIGIVSYDATLYGPASSIYSVEKASREAGYFVSIWRRSRKRPPSSWPMTTWRWECCAPCARLAGECPTMSAWSASTTSRRRAS